jgi:capsular exopolysaccharide synthesis family protein
LISQQPAPEQPGSALILRPDNPLAPYVSPAPANEIDDSLHLRDLLRIIYKRKWWILSVAAVMLVAATLSTLMETPLYRATTTIQIDRQAQRVVDYRDATGSAEQYSDDGMFFQTQLELLRSKALAERVMEMLRLDIDRPQTPVAGSAAPPPKAAAAETVERDDWIGRITTTLRKRSEPSVKDAQVLDRESVLASLRGSMQIDPVPNSRLVRIHVTGADPALAARMANAWSEAYIKTNLERKVDASSYARTFLEQELAKAKIRLEESENSLVQYTRQKQILSVDEKSNPLTQNFTDFSAALAKAEQDRYRAEANYDEVKRTLSSSKDLLDNKALATFRENKAKLELEYQEQLRTYKPGHPKMVALQAQIDVAEARIQTESKAITSSVEITAKAAFDAAKAQEDRLRARVELSKRNILEVQDQGIRFNILKRDVDTNREMYSGLLQRLKEVGVTAQVGTNNVSVVDKADVPLFPFRPDVMRGALTGLLLGLMAGLALAFVIEYMDDSIKFPDEVERFTGLPLIGVIPRVNTSKGSPEDQATRDPRSSLAEAYRSVRTALQFSTSKGAPRTIVVTSCTKNEGKSTTAMALAVALSQMGKRVLLVDGDMRNPTLHRMFNTDHAVGLSNILSSDADPITVTRKTDFPNLYLITGGPLPPNPAELLSGPSLQKLLSPGASLFDHIVIDAPPILGIADSIILCNHVDATLFVVESAKTRKAAIRNAIRRLRQAGTAPLGAILTKLGSEMTMYGYESDFYYYGNKAEIANAEKA